MYVAETIFYWVDFLEELDQLNGAVNQRETIRKMTLLLIKASGRIGYASRGGAIYIYPLEERAAIGMITAEGRLEVKTGELWAYVENLNDMMTASHCG